MVDWLGWHRRLGFGFEIVSLCEIWMEANFECECTEPESD